MTATLIKADQIKAATFTVAAAPFAEAVTLASKVTMKNYPVVTLAFRDQRVAVQATDIETTVSIKVPVVGKKATTVAVDAAKLKAFAGALKSNDRVEIDVQPDVVVVSAGDLVYELPPFQNPPIVITPDQVNPVDFDRSLLTTAIRTTAPAVSGDDTRVILTGVLFSGGQAVATDSYRLAVADAPDFGRDLLVPGKALALADQIIRTETDVKVDVLDKVVHFVTPLRSVVIRLIDGDFPAWRNIVPAAAAQPVAVTVDRAALRDRVRKVALAGGDGVAARLTVGDGVLGVSLVRQDVAKANADGLPAEVTGSIDYAVGVNPQYLAELLGAVDTVQVTLRLHESPVKPMLIDAADATWLIVLMPVRLP